MELRESSVQNGFIQRPTTENTGRAIAQAHKPMDSHRGGPGLVMWDFMMDKSALGQVYSEELRFSLPIYIPSASPQSSSLSPEADTIGQEWPQCQ
jgi:hypothetical protein